ncbi:hypothetical protein SAMN05444274_106112 [Mariniphaga anaerophila]|uniref:Uncharacterized protein n=1 Tax=Mariniphaga anaerophila TaxID=1484053 RepID=A0A1M5CG93_9BACT|nr:hypothetical protein [Mariniphaga anaerophila]SHF53765.1 hypothetical protein SAMN05444274_106112 [Mariniphaga anaerophila]
MKKLSVIIASFILVFGFSNALLAQDSSTARHDVGITVPSMAIIDIEGAGEGGSINLTVSADGIEAGDAVDFSTASNNELWLNYTAISGGKSREISAKLENASLPSGVSLMLKVEGQTNGVGDLGEVVNTGSTALGTANSLKVVNGIGSCYTGNGTGSGHQLVYSLEMSDDGYSELVSGSNYSTTVVYTITETN